MPAIDLAELGTILITAVVGGAVGYAIHWLQTREKRKWEKERDQKIRERESLEEKQKATRAYIQSVLLWVLDLSSELSSLIPALVGRANADRVIDGINRKLNEEEIKFSSTRLRLPKDEELTHLLQQFDNEKNSLSEALNAISDSRLQNRELAKTMSERAKRFPEIGGLIDQRFEELKDQVMKEL